MNRCQWCGRVPSGFGMVVLTIKEDEPSQSICRDCYNEFAANMLGIEDYKDFEKEAIFTDCDGIEHRFQVGKMINPTGICWKAVEFICENKIGYSFEAHQDFEEDSNDALERLHKKIRKGLSKKFIRKEMFQGQELISIKENIVEGRIEWDDRYSDRTPKFIIDGQEYSLEEFGRILMSCEGWNFRLEIIEPTE
jgi:hypothetical protein